MRHGFWVETSGREKPLLQLSEEALVGPLGKVGGRRAGAHPRFQRSLEKIDQISSERVDLRVQIVCLVAPAFGGGVWALGFLRGATRRKIPKPPCRGKRDLRSGRVAGFSPRHAHFLAPSFPTDQHFLAPSFRRRSDRPPPVSSPRSGLQTLESNGSAFSA